MIFSHHCSGHTPTLVGSLAARLSPQAQSRDLPSQERSILAIVARSFGAARKYLREIETLGNCV